MGINTPSGSKSLRQFRGSFLQARVPNVQFVNRPQGERCGEDEVTAERNHGINKDSILGKNLALVPYAREGPASPLRTLHLSREQTDANLTF